MSAAIRKRLEALLAHCERESAEAQSLLLPSVAMEWSERASALRSVLGVGR